ncbi:MAG TPA: 3-phosphoshikimate 1-carboxyvinyltransferase [candidate division Zixibacteria bacterium]|nr:3-phosphoshikimate 1-carboxyvinyltransferase [candidate division Zixibacteria bacterium]
MKREIKPIRGCEATLMVPGDKSIAHRAALLSLLSRGPLTVVNFPDSEDCARSLSAAERFGTGVERVEDRLVLTPPATITAEPEMNVDCGNSGTTARLLSGIIAGSKLEATLCGDSSLSRRPMKRIIDPLSEMGAELFADEGHLPMRIRGGKLMPLEYTLPVASAQVKSALLLAGLASNCSVTVREKTLTRDHTERMIEALGQNITIRDIKPVYETDPVDPRKRRQVMPEDFKREISISPQTQVDGGEISIPGDISTASYFWAAAAISGGTVTVKNVGLNPTRTGFIDHLRAVGCKVEITDRETLSGEPRGTVTVIGQRLRARKIAGETTVNLIDEIPVIAVMAAFADGTTVIRDADELKVKESNRLQAIEHNLRLMGIKCGTLADGLAIEGGTEMSGADFMSFGDHRISMAFSVGALFLTGPSTIDDDSVVAASCPTFYDLLKQLSQ